MRWSEKETCQFVKLFLKHEYLWNTDHPNYKLKDLRQKAYSDIIAAFKAATGITLYECEAKVKIKNLRSTYSQELVKIRRRSSPDSVYKPSIKWFADWHRCFGKQARRHRSDASVDTDQQEEQDVTDNCQKIWVNQHTDAEHEDSNNALDSPTDEDYLLILKDEPVESSQVKEEHTHKLCKVKKKDHSIHNSDRTHRSSTDSEPILREDEFDIYGKYIASQLRKMNLQKALRLQLEIQSLVSEARISDLRTKE